MHNPGMWIASLGIMSRHYPYLGIHVHVEVQTNTHSF